MSGGITLLHQNAFMEWSSVKKITGTNLPYFTLLFYLTKLSGIAQS